MEKAGADEGITKIFDRKEPFRKVIYFVYDIPSHYIHFKVKGLILELIMIGAKDGR